jgi:hypothetical protein
MSGKVMVVKNGRSKAWNPKACVVFGDAASGDVGAEDVVVVEKSHRMLNGHIKLALVLNATLLRIMVSSKR